MAHSFVCSYFHCTWSTHERRTLIQGELKERLWPYIGGIARQERMKALSVGGTNNHVHVLLSLPAAMPISKAVQLLKCNSSGWINDLSPAHKGFAWQEGYGAFSVSASALAQVTEYIGRQEEHHRRRTFEEEYLALLDRHQIPHDAQHVFG